MPVRERTSIELPSALSGSNELIACPGVISTWTVAVCEYAATATSAHRAYRVIVSQGGIISRATLGRETDDQSVICSSSEFLRNTHSHGLGALRNPIVHVDAHQHVETVRIRRRRPPELRQEAFVRGSFRG